MEKNKKVELFLGLVIIIFLSVLVYREYVKKLRREGFLPLAMAYTVFYTLFQYAVTTLPTMFMFFMCVIVPYVLFSHLLPSARSFIVFLFTPKMYAVNS